MESNRQLFNAVLNELTGNIYTIENANKIFKRQVFWDSDRKWARQKYNFCNGKGWTCDGKYDRFYCIFGSYLFDGRKEELKLIKCDKNPITHLKCRMLSFCKCYKKNGVEVLGMKPERTKDGKYTYKGLIIGELKKACKENGIKGFSKMDKCELVKALMNC
jgi:hypothetical protein